MILSVSFAGDTPVRCGAIEVIIMAMDAAF
jgi:hypothetical protein